jgi:hypothetical protein
MGVFGVVVEMDCWSAEHRDVAVQLFPDRPLSRFGDITWPACSLYLALPDYLLWGYVKSDVREIYPASIDDLNISCQY